MYMKLIKFDKWYRSHKNTADRVGCEGNERTGGGPGGQRWRSAVVGAERGTGALTNCEE